MREALESLECLSTVQVHREPSMIELPGWISLSKRDSYVKTSRDLTQYLVAEDVVTIGSNQFKVSALSPFTKKGFSLADELHSTQTQPFLQESLAATKKHKQVQGYTWQIMVEKHFVPVQTWFL